MDPACATMRATSVHAVEWSSRPVRKREGLLHLLVMARPDGSRNGMRKTT
jgi:hypothetical protein